MMMVSNVFIWHPDVGRKGPPIASVDSVHGCWQEDQYHKDPCVSHDLFVVDVAEDPF